VVLAVAGERRVVQQDDALVRRDLLALVELHREELSG
jgi:hypothetical protein